MDLDKVLGRQRAGAVYLTLAMMTVGSTVIASKLIGQETASVTAAALRFLIALPILVAICLWMRMRLPPMDLRTWGLLLVQASVGSVGYTLLLIAGTARTSALDASVIVGTLPAVAALFSVLVLGERLTARLAWSLGLALSAVLLVSIPTSRTAAGDTSWIGNAMVLGAVCCEAVFILLQKRMQTPLEPLAQSTLMTALSLLVSGLAAVLLESPFSASISSASLLAISYYAVIPTVAGFLLWYAGAVRVSGVKAAVFTAVSPLTAAVLSVLVLAESIRLTHGLALIGVVLAIRISAKES
jgi:drug/metabolite transporter (DMT)-like permease